VGAGLPAIQAPRYFSSTQVMQSQASQLPHKPAPTQGPAPTGSGVDIDICLFLQKRRALNRVQVLTA